MKQLYPILIFLLFLPVAFGGKAVIYSGTDVKALKPNLDLNGAAKIVTGTSDPTLVAPESSPQGSLYLWDGPTGGSVLVHTDSGVSNNWANLFRLTSQPAHSVLIGPSVGVSGIPSFRGVLSSDLPDLSGLYLPLSGGTLTGPLILAADPILGLGAATKQYVDTVASQLNPIQAAYAATPGTNIPGVYANGAAGIGATFTPTATGALSMDGVSPALNSRVLLKDQTSGFQNGVYNVTLVGALGISPILTRALDYDTSVDMNAGDLIPVIAGTVNAGTTWLQTATITTVGVDSLVFTKWANNSNSYLASTLTSSHVLVGNALNLAVDTALSQDVTLANTGAVTISNNVVTNAKLAQMAASTIKGNNTGVLANALDLTATQTTAMLNNFIGDSGAGGTKGLVLAPAAGDAAAGKFLKSDGTWAVPSATGGVNFPVTSYTADAVITNAEYDIFLDPSGGTSTINVTLFTAVGNSGHHLNFTQISAGVVNYSTVSGQTIGFSGDTSAVTNTKGTLTLDSNGSNWYVQ